MVGKPTSGGGFPISAELHMTKATPPAALAALALRDSIVKKPLHLGEAARFRQVRAYVTERIARARRSLTRTAARISVSART